MRGPVIIDLFDTHSDCRIKVARVDPTALLSEPPLLGDVDAGAVLVAP